MDVKIYTTPSCGYCHQAKRFLSERGVRFTEHDVSRDREVADDMVRMTGQTGVPVIVVDGEVIIGFDRPRLEHLLSKSNERPHIGLKVADSSILSKKHGTSPVPGAYIGAVAPSSPAERAGLRKGDIITKVNLEPVNNADDLERITANLTPGNQATIVFLRGQDTYKADITI